MVTAQDQLQDLQWNWSGAYKITAAGGHWLAQRRDDGHTLTASSPEELRDLLAEDYRSRPVSRDIAPGSPS